VRSELERERRSLEHAKAMEERPVLDGELHAAKWAAQRGRRQQPNSERTSNCREMDKYEVEDILLDDKTQ